MATEERRVSPRKECLVPIRFRVVQNGNARADQAVRLTDSGRGSGTHAHFGMMEGQAVNLSERGVYFVCRENVMTGEEVEMFFTIPSALTGRAAESIRCRARVVHAEPLAGNRELTGAGAAVDRFECLA